MAEPPLPDIWLGSKDAPVTIIEYASMTCTHCAAFHAETWPTLKIEIYRHRQGALHAARVPARPARHRRLHAGPLRRADKRNAIVDLLFAQQKNWAFVDKPVEALARHRQAGRHHRTTTSRPASRTRSSTTRSTPSATRPAKEFKVDATPTFFINGMKHAGELSVAELDKILAPLVKS